MGFCIKKLSFLALFLCFTSLQAEVLCAKKRVKVNNGFVKLGANVKTVSGDTCPSRFRLVKNLNSFAAAAFAKIDGSGNILNFGGANVQSAVASVPAPGRFEITFFGNFNLPTSDDSTTNRNLLTVNSSSVADSYGITNNGVLSASASSITIVVFQWIGTTPFETDVSQSGVNISVFQGKNS